MGLWGHFGRCAARARGTSEAAIPDRLVAAYIRNTALGFPFQTSQARNHRPGDATLPHCSFCAGILCILLRTDGIQDTRNSRRPSLGRSQTHKGATCPLHPHPLWTFNPADARRPSNPTLDAAVTKVLQAGEWHIAKAKPRAVCGEGGLAKPQTRRATTRSGPQPPFSPSQRLSVVDSISVRLPCRETPLQSLLVPPCLTATREDAKRKPAIDQLVWGGPDNGLEGLHR